MQDFKNKNIVLGVGGGIAAYKTVQLVRELTTLGAEVRVVMTTAAQQFITPMTFQALTGHDVRIDLFDSQAERAMGHIELARWADYLVIAPASANRLAKMAHGIADDLLSTLYLVCEKPVLVCPAMNRSMWAHPATVANCQLLQDRGVVFIGPTEGAQACQEVGLGRMSEPVDIIDGLRLQGVNRLLRGRHVLITAGPTQEAIDPVRYIGNYSSGKMGYALAKAALMAGAEVTLISGPTALPKPPGINFYAVKSAKAMHDEVMKRLQPGMIVMASAAVADYHVAHPVAEKIKKQAAAPLSLSLVVNADIIATVAASKKAAYLVGFAAETHDVLAYAKQKMKAKSLDMIVANQVGEGLGFENTYHEVTVLTKTKMIPLALQHKTRLAAEIIAILAANLQNDVPQ